MVNSGFQVSDFGCRGTAYARTTEDVTTEDKAPEDRKQRSEDRSQKLVGSFSGGQRSEYGSHLAATNYVRSTNDGRRPNYACSANNN